MNLRLQTIFQYIAVLFLLVCTSGCSKYVIEEETQNEGTLQSVSFKLTNNNIHIEYPAQLYLFNKDKSLKNSYTIDGHSPLQYQLPAGQYSACIHSSLHNEYTLPSPVSSDDILQHRNGNFSTSPFTAGTCLFEVTKDTEVTMDLKYMVSRFSFSVQNVPDNVNDVNVIIGSTSSGVTLQGNYTNDGHQPQIPLSRNADTWTADNIYLFPGHQAKTNIVFNVVFPDKTRSFNYTLNSPIEEGGVYHINGKYISGNHEDKIVIEGIFQLDGWREEVNIEIPLVEGEEQNNNGNDDNTEIDHLIATGDLPQSESLWGDQFYVWKVKHVNTNEIIATLISLYQGYDYAANAIAILSGLNIDGLTGWHFFTEEQAKDIKLQYTADALKELNNFFITNNAPIFKNSDGDRYLCNDGKKTFSFNSNRITAAGGKTKYYFRGVKTVRITRK